jgi:hypothetical protein
VTEDAQEKSLSVKDEWFDVTILFLPLKWHLLLFLALRTGTPALPPQHTGACEGTLKSRTSELQIASRFSKWVERDVAGSAALRVAVATACGEGSGLNTTSMQQWQIAATALRREHLLHISQVSLVVSRRIRGCIWVDTGWRKCRRGISAGLHRGRSASSTTPA